MDFIRNVNYLPSISNTSYQKLTISHRCSNESRKNQFIRLFVHAI